MVTPCGFILIRLWVGVPLIFRVGSNFLRESCAVGDTLGQAPPECFNECFFKAPVGDA